MTGLDRRVNAVALATAFIAAVTLIVVAYSVPAILESNDNTEALRELQAANACRSDITAEDAKALGQVILTIAQGIGGTEDRAIYLERIRTATAELERTQEVRARINEICDQGDTK